MGRLEELITKFREDETWNTLEKDGTHRFDKEILWIENMIKSYADYFKLNTDEVVDIMEKNRHMSWVNYYQHSSFPDVSEFDKLIGIFQTYEDFNEHARRNWKGFKCPKCGDITLYPQQCKHRVAKDGKCDWCSFGLFESPDRVIILESGFKTIPIFEPVELEEGEKWTKIEGE